MKAFMVIVDYFLSVGLRILIFVISHIPVRLAYLSCEVIGRFFYYILPKKRRQIFKNLTIVYPDGPPFNKKQMAKKVFVNFCKTVIDLFLAQRILNRKNLHDYVSGPGFDVLKEFNVDTGGYGLIVTPHIGSVLASIHISSCLNIKTELVIRAQGMKRTNQVFLSLFTASGCNVVLKQSAYESMKEVVENKGVPIVAMDQHAGRKSLHVDFLGRKAYTAAGVVSIARKYKIPIIAAATIRTECFKFKLYAKRIPYIFTEDKQADLENMAAKINQIFGEYILTYPEQWFWMHRRWR